MELSDQIYLWLHPALAISATFAAWGLLIKHKLTQPDMIFGKLPEWLPDTTVTSKPIYACAVCVAGFWCFWFCLGGVVAGLLPVALVVVCPVWAMFFAWFVEWK